MIKILEIRVINNPFPNLTKHCLLLMQVILITNLTV